MLRHARLRPLLGLLAAGLALAGCMTSHDVIAGKSWTLVSVAGRPPAAAASLALRADGTLALATGCNDGSGTYTLDGNRLTASLLALTQVGCADAVGAQEQAILGVVSSTPTYAVDTGSAHLRLTGADGTVLLFDAR